MFPSESPRGQLVLESAIYSRHWKSIYRKSSHRDLLRAHWYSQMVDNFHLLTSMIVATTKPVGDLRMSTRHTKSGDAIGTVDISPQTQRLGKQYRAPPAMGHGPRSEDVPG